MLGYQSGPKIQHWQHSSRPPQGGDHSTHSYRWTPVEKRVKPSSSQLCTRQRSLRCYASEKSSGVASNLRTWGANFLSSIRGLGEQPKNATHKQLLREEEIQPEEDLSGTEQSLSQEAFQEEQRIARRERYRHLGPMVDDEWPPPGTPTWSQWEEAFDTADMLEDRREELEQSIEQAVKKEDFQAAAAVQAELDSLLQSDTVAKIVEDYKKAIQDEDFSKAAHLRDWGNTSLVGWWWPQSSDPRNPGHLLRIVPALNHYVGVSYSPTELSVLHGWRHPSSSQASPDQEMSSDVIPSSEDYDQAGSPVIELHYARFSDDDTVHQQTCAFHGQEDLPPGAESLTDLSGAQVMTVQSVDAEPSNADGIQVVKLVMDRQPSGLGSEPLEVPDAFPHILQQQVERIPATLVKFAGDRDRILLNIPDVQEAIAKDDLSESEEQDTDDAAESNIVEASMALSTLSAEREVKSSVNVVMDAAGKQVDWQDLADQIAANLDQPLERDQLAETLKAAVEASVSMSDLGGYGLKGAITYKRLPANMATTDPFTGIFLGSFGAHGPELLLLQRAINEEGQEVVEGMKLTGDPNVPAGNVSFKAVIGAKNRLPLHGAYPPELPVSARYKGYGRVAQAGFQNPRWIEGELLQFSPCYGMPKSMELGFVWNGMGTQGAYLSMFSRISLDDPLQGK